MYTKSAGIRIFVLSTETLNFGPQLNVLVKNFSILPKHGEMILPPFTFMVNPTMNLMSEPHYEYEKRKHHSLYSEST